MADIRRGLRGPSEDRTGGDGFLAVTAAVIASRFHRDMIELIVVIALLGIALQVYG